MRGERPPVSVLSLALVYHDKFPGLSDGNDKKERSTTRGDDYHALNKDALNKVALLNRVALS